MQLWYWEETSSGTPGEHMKSPRTAQEIHRVANATARKFQKKKICLEVHEGTHIKGAV